MLFGFLRPVFARAGFGGWTLQPPPERPQVHPGPHGARHGPQPAGGGAGGGAAAAAMSAVPAGAGHSQGEHQGYTQGQSGLPGLPTQRSGELFYIYDVECPIGERL